MNWTKIKNFLNAVFFPTSVAVEEMMKDIREASDKFKKELQKEVDSGLVVYHYCAKQGFKWKSGYVTVPKGELDPLTNKNVRISFESKFRAIRENIAWLTNFDPEKMVIVSLNEIHSI
jgi:hypothetical protein